MRVLFLNPCAQLGGAERCLLDLLASLACAEPQWKLHLIAGEDGPLLVEARALGVEAECVLFPRALAELGSTKLSPDAALRALPGAWLYRQQLNAAIWKTAPDLIHTNGLKMHLLGAWCGVPELPVIWHLHDYLAARGSVSRLLRYSIARPSGAIAISQSVAAEFHAHFAPAFSVKTVLNGVDLSRFHPQGPKLDLAGMAGVRLRAGTIRVGLVATFARWKGHEVFLRALAHPAVRGCDIHAFVIGGPIYQTAHSQHSLPELRELATSLGIEHRVTFTGFLSDTASAMRALDIVVHASTEPEPFGLTIAEAMACGRAVIASQGGAADELFTDGRNAIGVPPGDSAALATAIAQLGRDGILRMCLGRAARATAESRFNRDRLGPAVAQFYREVLQPCEYSTSTAEISTAA